MFCAQTLAHLWEISFLRNDFFPNLTTCKQKLDSLISGLVMIQVHHLYDMLLLLSEDPGKNKCGVLIQIYQGRCNL